MLPDLKPPEDCAVSECSIAHTPIATPTIASTPSNDRPKSEEDRAALWTSAQTLSARHRRRRRCLILGVVSCAGVVALLTVILVPIMVYVVIPASIQKSFASDNGGQPLLITNLSFYGMTESSTLLTFIAYSEGVSLPLNIPLRMIQPSDWKLSARYANSTVPEDWYPIGHAPAVAANFLVHNGRCDINATSFSVNVLDGGASLGQLLGGVGRMLEAGTSGIPLLKIEIVTAFWLGSLYVAPIHLEKIVDVGKWLSTPPPTSRSGSKGSGTTTFSPGPVTVSAAGDVSASVQISIPPPGSPIGVDFKDVNFNLAVDSDTFARTHIETLLLYAGSTLLSLPLQFTGIGVGGLLNGLLSSFVSSKSLRAFNVTALSGDGLSIPWLNTMFSYLEFQLPLSLGGTGGSGGSLASWITGLLGNLGH